MKEESSKVVRRSSECEIFERIKSYAKSKSDYGLCGWVNLQLGVDSDFCEGEVSDERKVSAYEQEAFYRTFGPLRESQSLLTEKPQEFAEFVCGAYTDAVKYPEFTGIEIKADSSFVSGGGTSKTYCFEAKFFERLGISHQVYETKLSFKYLHFHEEGEHNIEDYVSGQLEDLRESLLERLKGSKIEVGNKTLHVSKKQEKMVQQ